MPDTNALPTARQGKPGCGAARRGFFHGARWWWWWTPAGILIFGLALWATPAHALEQAFPAPWPWWVWPVLLFFLTFVLGIVAVVAGIGGSVLFVPLVSGFLPALHIDFVRGAGLMVALSGALSAGPGLLRQGLAHLRLAIPISLVASFASIFGALAGLALPAQTVQTALGLVIIAMSGLMVFSGTGVSSYAGKPDRLVDWLGIEGIEVDPESGQSVTWRPRRMALALCLFSGVGFMAGLFGLGAGWANVPLLNMLMGVPLKAAVATSYFLLAITDTSAAWVYFHRGALIPLIVIPSVLGIMLGAKIGAKVLIAVRPVVVRRVVIGVLLLAGLRALLRGMGI